MTNLPSPLPSFINGGFRAAASPETFPTRNPATNEVICEVELAMDPEVQEAVQASRRAQTEWANKTGAERGRILTRTSQLLRAHNDELAALEVQDTGKPISEANTVDVTSGADALEYFGGLAASIKGDHYQLGKNFAYTRREPLGVVGAIGAWNYPLQIACWKAAPALAAGNAMVFKPSELTPLTAIRLAQIFQEAGLPDGVFNVIQGDHRTGQLLVGHPDVHKISLTGEVQTGRQVMGDAARQLKAVTLELGGKSPLLLFEDAHIENAVKGAILANFFTQGEVCTNGTRVFVQEKLLDRFLEALVPATQALRVGDPRDPEVQVGALISADHCERVLSYIRKGKEEGATLLCGGERVGTVGNFVSPAVFRDCADEMTIVQEEIFGPVMSVLSFKDEAEVVERANATPFGLAAGVFTRDLNRAHRVAAHIQAGTCWVNTYNMAPVEVPFGGWKQSGLGVENSEWALQHYTHLKTVYVETGDLE